MSIRDLSDEEQREAHIIAISEKFRSNMAEIDRKHAQTMRRIDYWSAFAQGVIIGTAATATLCLVMIAIAKAHHQL